VGKVYAEIDERIRAFIDAQHVFFVGTAPLAHRGHVNVSPKGLDTLRVLDSRTVAYLDLTGSGVETVAHLRENGRITIMFCAFEGAPKILRLNGRGTVIEPDDPVFAELYAQFPPFPGVRSVIRVAVERIADSCGYGVPLHHYEGERAQLREWAERKGPDGVRAYQAEHNATSIDGLPGVRGPEGT
jgi:hypothetical protein